MPQERLGNDEFLGRLTTLLSATHSQAHGSIFFTQKSLHTSDDTTSPPQVLVRATNGATVLSTPANKVHSNAKPAHTRGAPPKRIKIATVVDAEKIEDFYAKYAEVCKKGMEGLRKRDKKKLREREKAKKRGKGKT